MTEYQAERNDLGSELNDQCEICGLVFPDRRAAQRDHDHDTKEFRGTLCRGCNMALGRFSDVDILERAVNYLERYMTDIEKCVCGRSAARLHCAACGSFNCYAKSSKSRIEHLPDNRPIRVMMFHCRGCGIDFDDLQRAKCEAPQTSMKSVSQLRKEDKAHAAIASSFTVDMTYEERLAKAKELLSKAKPTPREEIK